MMHPDHRVEGEIPGRTPVQVDLAWSSRAFNLGLAFGCAAGCILGFIAAIATLPK